MIHDGFQLSLPFLPLTFAIFFVDKRCWLRDNWDRFLSKIQRVLSMCCGLQCLPSILIHGLLRPGRLRQHRFVRKWAAPRSRDMDKIHIERPSFFKANQGCSVEHWTAGGKCSWKTQRMLSLGSWTIRTNQRRTTKVQTCSYGALDM